MPTPWGLELTWPWVPEVLAGCEQAGCSGRIFLLPLGIWALWCAGISFLCSVDTGFVLFSGRVAKWRISEHSWGHCVLGCEVANDKTSGCCPVPAGMTGDVSGYTFPPPPHLEP